MNGTELGGPGLNETKVLNSIVNALSGNRLYVLIFGIIFLTLLLCLYAFTFGADEPYLRLAALIGLILESVVAFLLIRSLEINSSKNQIKELEAKLEEQTRLKANIESELEHHDEHEINLSDAVLRRHFKSAIGNTRNALGYQNKTFIMEIESAIASFAQETGEWSNGYFLTDALNYERIIWKFYKHATATVFATSNEYYLKFWENEEKARRIIEAHKAAYDMNKAMVTRIFVFSTIANIQQNQIDVMARQEKIPFINARALIVEDHENLGLAASLLMKDFVIIDKGLQTQAIGIESSADLSSVGAKWIFSRSPEIEQTAESMEQMSISIDDLRQRRGT